MLYKNLPDNELVPTVRMRFYLDHLAALQFLLKGDFKNARAVSQARRDFTSLKKSFSNVRSQNIAATKSFDIHERTSKSLLWQYYLKGKKRFTDFEL